MNNFFEWFSPKLKMKRWLLLLLIGVCLLSFSIAKFISNDELKMQQLLLYGSMFVLGFSASIMSFVMAERRILQSIAEANANPNGKNMNFKKLLFDKRMLDKNIKVVAIGSGDGIATLLKGLKIFSNNVTAIVSMVDDEKNMTENVSIQNVKKAIIALSNKEDVMEDFFTHRITTGALRGKNLGNTFFEQVSELCDGSLSKSIEYISKIVAMRGNVIPSTLDNVTVGAVFNNGTRVIGKKNLLNVVDERESTIEKVFLVPERCSPATDVIRSIKEADAIIIGPGNFYTGIIPTLLIKEVSDAIRKSKATKIYVSNIMTEKSQTDNYTLSDYINSINEHAGKGLFDYIIATDSDIMPEFIRRYNKEGSDLVEIDRANIRNMRLNLVVEDMAVVNDKNTIRHDSMKLAQSIFKIICDNMELEDDEKTLGYYTTKSKLKRVSQKAKKKNILFRDVKVIKNNKK